MVPTAHRPSDVWSGLMHAASITLLSWAMIGAACLFPGSATLALGSVLAVLVAVLGLPHGAADHLFARPRLEPLVGPAWQLVFLGWYVVVAATVVGGWFVAPAATVVLFFLASAWHFGQEEPRLVMTPLWLRPIFRFARGGLVLWGLLAFQPAAVLRVLSVVVPRENDVAPGVALGWLTFCAWSMLAIAALEWLMQMKHALTSRANRRRVLLADNVMVASLLMLCGIASPVISFLTYFCGWHSVRGLKRLRRELGVTWIQLVRSLAGMTAASVALLAVAAWFLFVGPNLDSTLTRSTFVGLSSVAVPHLLLHGGVSFFDRRARDNSLNGCQLGNAA